METLLERCAGLDLHKDVIAACVRVPGPNVERSVHQHEFGTTTQELLGLHDWLGSHGVTVVGMEATGVYWKAPFYLLEESFECWLLNARHMHNLPGRKTDVADAAWIAQLVEHGLVRPSFVPPKPIRELRNLTRYRKAQIEERGREAQRLDKILQDAGIKISSVASNILGVSGRAMLDAMVRGSSDPGTLSDLAKGRLRSKIPALREALQGRFTPHHALLVGEILSKLDYMEQAIGRLSDEIDRVIAPFAPQVEFLSTIPGVDKRTAETLLAEIGTDMSRFGSSARLASWAGMCPGQYESAGKSKRGTTRHGSKWLRTALVESAKAASRTKNTYFGAQYNRLHGRRGHEKATVAVGHSILVAAYYILEHNVPYADIGEDWFIRRDSQDRHAKKLVSQLKALGYEVTIEHAA